MDHTTADEEPSMRRKLMSLTPSSCCGSGSSGAESSAESSASTSPRGQPRSVGKLMRKLGRRKKKSAPTSAAQVAVLESPQPPSQQTSESEYSSPRLPAMSGAGEQGSTSQAEGAEPTASTENLDSCSSIVYFRNNFSTCFQRALHPFIISEDALLDLTRRSVDKVRNSLYEKLKDKDLQKGDEETLRTKLRLWEVQLSSQSEDDVSHVVLLTARGRTNDLSAQDPASCTVIQKSLGLFGKDAVFLPDGQLVFALDPNPGKSATQS